MFAKKIHRSDMIRCVSRQSNLIDIKKNKQR